MAKGGREPKKAKKEVVKTNASAVSTKGAATAGAPAKKAGK
jgi:hypothetical protein